MRVCAAGTHIRENWARGTRSSASGFGFVMKGGGEDGKSRSAM